MVESHTNTKLTEGDLARPMLRLAWPLVAIQLLQVTYNLADTAWLGAYSSNAVGALSLAFPLIFFLISVGGGFTAAGAILVAQYTGADSDGSASLVAGQTIGFVGLLSVVIGAVGYLLTDPMLAVLPADPETQRVIVPLAADYMRIFFLGMPFLFGFFVFVSLLRGYGNTRTPLRIMLVSVALNVVLDPLVIFGVGPFPELGIEGAALATVFSRGVATLLGLYLLFWTDAGPDVGAADLAPDLETIRDIVRIGVPSAAEQSMTSLALIALTGMVATFPPAVVTAYGLGNRVISLVFLPAMGLGQATNTVVGQNLGAEQPERAERATWLAAKFAAVGLFGVALVIFAVPTLVLRPLLTADTAQAAETLVYGAEYLRIAAPAFVFMGLFPVFLGAFRGSGDTKTALVFSVVALWLVRVPTTYVLVFVLGWDATGVFTAVALGDVVGALAAMAWFSRGTWKHTVVEGGRERESAVTDGGTESSAD
ncbi:MATE family efflux transporter [Haloarchaeobius sp. FL176]|uniref:MATE family efflux transporter n=1 Tax=Haloarchaeobius sp. FL176 TaxID=2967129 RepID=UPI0021492878|nr:MATE family efflux transporter [Haloarchaeobius sp. FL176]